MDDGRDTADNADLWLTDRAAWNADQARRLGEWAASIELPGDAVIRRIREQDEAEAQSRGITLAELLDLEPYRRTAHG